MSFRRSVEYSLLHAEEHEDLPVAGCQRLKGLADDGSGLMELAAVDLDRLGPHRRPGLLATDEQVADLDGMLRSVDMNLDAAGGCDPGLGAAGDTEEHARLFGHDAGYCGVIRPGRRHHLVVLIGIQDDDGTWRHGLGGRYPFGDVLILGDDVVTGDRAGGSDAAIDQSASVNRQARRLVELTGRSLSNDDGAAAAVGDGNVVH